MNIEININDSLTREQLWKLKSFNDDYTPVLKDIGIYALRSVDLNYIQGGRPNRWPLTEAAKKRNGMTLIDTGRLRRSTQVSASGDIESGDSAYNISKTDIKIGTKVPYYWDVWKDKNNSLHTKYPAIILQDEDIPMFEQIIKRHLDRI